MNNSAEQELEDLRKRCARLAEEKANLQLVVRLTEQLNPQPGLEPMISGILNAVMETIGGTDIKIWYFSDSVIHTAGFTDGFGTTDSIADSAVLKALDSGEIVEEACSAESALLRDGVLPGAYSWAFPLSVGDRTIGAVKLENIHMSAGKLRTVLPVFFRQTALLISNELKYRSQKRAEAELREKTAELDSYFADSLDLFSITDREGRFLKVNHAWERTLGYSEEFLSGKRFIEFVHPEDRQKTEEASQKSCIEEVSSFTNRYRTADGNWRRLEWRARPSGSIICASARDITERYEQDLELRSLRSYLADIIDSMPSVLIGTDAAGKVILWNSAAEKRTGVTAAKAEGSDLTDLIPHLADDSDRIHRSLSSGLAVTEIRKIASGSGDPLFEEITIYPLSGGDGVVIRLDDVTGRRQMEELLVQSQKMLSIGGLAAGMAHEINNPLGGMMQSADLVRDRLANCELPVNIRTAQECGTSIEAVAEYLRKRNVLEILERIKSSGSRAAEIVRSMLSFARKSSVFSSHRLDELLDQCIALAGTDYDLKKKYDFRSIAIDRYYDADIPPIPCESARLRQVFLNILRNGAEAMLETDRDPHFTIRIKKDSENHCAVVEIEDNGPGIPEELRQRIFDPFFTTKPAGVGTGLGLSVSYFIVTENHHGIMSVDSVPGSGTCFSVSLPLS